MVVYAAPVWRFSAGFPEAATAMTEPIKVARTRPVPGRYVRTAWLASAGFAPREIEPLPGDVSPRRYFRAVLADGGSAILATYPPEVRSTCPRFLTTTAILEGIGVRVPRVLASDCEAGWMLVEDLGPRTLGDWGKGRPWSELDALFRAGPGDRGPHRTPARRTGWRSSTRRSAASCCARELHQTWDLFLEPQGLVGDPALAADLRDGPGPALREPRGRGARALPPRLHGAQPDAADRRAAILAVLDHQDLRLGPPLYDVASLLNDTLFPPPEVEEALLGALSWGLRDTTGPRPSARSRRWAPMPRSPGAGRTATCRSSRRRWHASWTTSPAFRRVRPWPRVSPGPGVPSWSLRTARTLIC